MGVRQRRGSSVSTALMWAVVWSAMIAGCQVPPSSPEKSPDEQSTVHTEVLPILEAEPPMPGDVRQLQNCAEYPLEPAVRGPWESYENKSQASQNQPRHHTGDRVAAVGEPVHLGAQFAYGKAPLAGEWIRLFVGDCDGWQQVSVGRTDDEGRAVFRLDTRRPRGVYGVAYQVVADERLLRAQLWVVSEQTDIVGIELAGGAFDVEPGASAQEADTVIPGAVELVRRHADRGQLVVYVHRGDGIVGVESWRRRLRDAGFPVGPVVVLESQESARQKPTDAGWGVSNDRPVYTTVVDPGFAVLYAATPKRARALGNYGVDIDREVHCTDPDDSATDVRCSGWSETIHGTEDIGEQ